MIFWLNGHPRHLNSVFGNKIRFRIKRRRFTTIYCVSLANLRFGLVREKWPTHEFRDPVGCG
jgi:hypothetical protein